MHMRNIECIAGGGRSWHEKKHLDVAFKTHTEETGALSSQTGAGMKHNSLCRTTRDYGIKVTFLLTRAVCLHEFWGLTIFAKQVSKLIRYSRGSELLVLLFCTCHIGFS